MSRLGAAAIAVAFGGAGAGLFLTLLLGTPGAMILFYLMQLPLFVTGLWLGTGAAAIAGTTACVVLLLASGMMAVIAFAALAAGPIVLLVRQALLARQGPDAGLHWYPAGLLAAWLTALGLAEIGGAVLVLGGPRSALATLSSHIAQALDRFPLEGGASDRAHMAAVLALVFPGLAAASWMVMTTINGILAQGLLARFNANWRPSPNLAQLDLPMWVSVAFAIAAAAVAFDGTSRFVGINVLIALVVPFSLAGLAIVHAALRSASHRGTALVLFYVLAGLFGWPLVVAALLGLFEPWLGLRRRFVSAREKS
jgi:hypothetical protein